MRQSHVCLTLNVRICHIVVKMWRLHSLKILKEYAVEEGICVKEYEKIIGKLEK